MKKLAVWILILIFLTCYSYALECQYTTNESYAVEEILLYENESDDYIGPNLRFYDFNFDGASFKVYNTLRFDINIIVYYDFVYTFWGGQKERRSRELFIKKGSYEIVKDEWKCYTCTGFSILENSIDFVITNPGPIVPVKKMVTKTREVCKLCGDSICLDDGSPCNKSSECGGGFCVEGYCSNSEYCYEKDCKCSADEIQCSDNMHCVKKGIIPIDVTPECGKDSECVTGYIDKKTGLCAKSPTQKKDNMVYILLSTTIIGLLALVLLSILEREKRRRLEKEAELIRIRYEKKNEELEKIKREIKELEEQRVVKQEEEERHRKLRIKVNSVKEEINHIYIEMEDAWNKIKPFPDAQVGNRLVIVNPFLGGYRCFYNKGVPLNEYSINSLVHRWVWTKYNGRNPRPGYHIHHIDGNKYNNEIGNLQEVEGEEHYSYHRRQHR